MSDWSTLVESGRSIIAGSRLGGTDEKFALGDLLVAQGNADDADLEAVAKEIGHGLTKGNLRSYREVAQAWPPECRVEASWTTHRTLGKMPNRFDLIRPGMTLRDAQAAAGKRTSDVKHPSRWPFEERVDFLITQLQDKDTNEAVRDHAEQRKLSRNVRKAARAVAEERSAEYQEALRNLREKNNAKHPERAVFDAILKVRDAAEYVRAIGRASVDENSFLPEHRKPDVVAAVRDLASITIQALDSIGQSDRSLVVDAIDALKQELRKLGAEQVQPSFKGQIIDL